MELIPQEFHENQGSWGMCHRLLSRKIDFEDCYIDLIQSFRQTMSMNDIFVTLSKRVQSQAKRKATSPLQSQRIAKVFVFDLDPD